MQYAGLFDDYRRLSKIALLFERLKVEATQLPWVFDYASKGKWLDVGQRHQRCRTGGAGLSELSELVRLFAVARRAPYSVKLIDDLLRLANEPDNNFDDLIQFIGANTAWSEERSQAGLQGPVPVEAGGFHQRKALDDCMRP